MSHSAAGPDARVIAEALLAHVEQKPVRAEVVEQLGSLEHAVGTDRLVSALHAAQLGEGAARAVGVRAATAGEVALAARFAGVGSIERALRQADRLLPREHTDGLFTVRALEPGEAKIVYRASTPVDPLLCAVRAGLLSGLPRCFGSSRARVEANRHLRREVEDLRLAVGRLYAESDAGSQRLAEGSEHGMVNSA